MYAHTRIARVTDLLTRHSARAACNTYNPCMARTRLLALSCLLLTGCGSDSTAGRPSVMASYVMGSVDEARRKATEPETEDPAAGMTLRELAESDEVFTFSGTIDILLVLNEDETFEYYGPLEMGDDQDLIHGRWTRVDDALHLHLKEPRQSKNTLVSRLVCPWSNDAVDYPLGRDPEQQVYYRLVDTGRTQELQSGIIIGGQPKGGG